MWPTIFSSNRTVNQSFEILRRCYVLKANSFEENITAKLELLQGISGWRCRLKKHVGGGLEFFLQQHVPFLIYFQ